MNVSLACSGAIGLAPSYWDNETVVSSGTSNLEHVAFGSVSYNVHLISILTISCAAALYDNEINKRCIV